MPFSFLLRHTQSSMWMRARIPLSDQIVRVLSVGLLATFGTLGQSPVPSTNTPQATLWSRKRLKFLLKTAHTSEDHRILAAYFRSREAAFRSEEEKELKLLAEYLNSPTRLPSKYPTHGDSLKHLANYHHAQAEKLAGLAKEHERLAASLETKK